MAIDTAAKRRSAVATRRLPWFRRFYPAPDGTVDQADRQSLAFVYGGIAGTPPVQFTPSVCFDLPNRQPRFDLPNRRPCWDLVKRR